MNQHLPGNANLRPELWERHDFHGKVFRQLQKPFLRRCPEVQNIFVLGIQAGLPRRRRPTSLSRMRGGRVKAGKMLDEFSRVAFYPSGVGQIRALRFNANFHKFPPRMLSGSTFCRKLIEATNNSQSSFWKNRSASKPIPYTKAPSAMTKPKFKPWTK